MTSSKKQPSSSLDRIVALSRTVKTQQGEKKFKEPVGSIIQPKSDVTATKVMNAAATATNATAVTTTTSTPTAVSLAHLKSLQTKLKLAKKTGNKGIEKQAETAFLEALRIYAEGKPASTVLAELGEK